MTACIRLATREDAGAIGALRTEAYAASPDFRIADPQFLDELRWSAADDAGNVVSVWRDGALLSTMRVEVLHDHADVARFAAGMLPPPEHTQFPALAIARTATHAGCRRSGLTSLIRWHVLRAALAVGAPRLYGYVVLADHRTRPLTSLGYELMPRSDRDPDLAGDLPWALAWLDLPRRGGEALARLDPGTRAARREHPWIGPPLRLPMLHGAGVPRDSTSPHGPPAFR